MTKIVIVLRGSDIEQVFIDLLTWAVIIELTAIWTEAQFGSFVVPSRCDSYTPISSLFSVPTSKQLSFTFFYQVIYPLDSTFFCKINPIKAVS